MQSLSEKMKLSIPDRIGKSINCCLWESTMKVKHYAYKAILLPCGGNACRGCIEGYEHDEDKFECSFCESTHEMEEITMIANPLVEYITISYLDDLKEPLLIEITETIKSMSEENWNKMIEVRFTNVEIELDIRIESIIAGLHEYREDFKKELDSMMQIYKGNFKFENLNEMKKKSDLLNTSLSAEIDYEGFNEAHRILIKSKLLLEKYTKDLNEIKLNSDKKIVYKELIGEVNLPSWKIINTATEIEIDESTSLIDLAYCESKDMLITLDVAGHLLTYDLNSEMCDKITEPLIQNPFAICNGIKDTFFVYDMIDEDNGGNKVFELSQDFKATFKFFIDDYIEYMNYESHDDRNLLYLLNCNGSKICIVDAENGREIKRIEINRPRYIEFSKERLYITSCTDYDETPHGQLDKITHGSNCIFVLNRNYEIMDKISFGNWLKPEGLYLNGEYLLTTAFELDRNKVISNIRYLHVIKDKKLLRKVKFDHGEASVYFFNNAAFILFSKTIKMIEFSN